MMSQWNQPYNYDDNDNIYFGDATKMIILMIIDENILVAMSFYCRLTNIEGKCFILSLHRHKNNNSKK